VFESVEIDGTEVQRASLHNISIIKNLGLTNGCTVNVFKANQIIPQINSCENDGNGEIEIPTTCPICGGTTAINKDNESEVLVCTNPNCSGKLLAKFVHFVSRKCMNIEGLAEALLERLISLNYINSFHDIYRLSNHHDQLIKLDGLGAKSVQKLLTAIEKSRNVKLENFIAALGIEGIGLSASKTIAQHCNHDVYALFDADDQSFDWTTLEDIGPTMAKNINEYFDNNFNSIFELAKEMHFIVPEQKRVTNNPFNGKSLCVTGKLNHFTRDSINEKIISLGAKAVGSVSKKCDYLITNEASGSSKYKKAVELGVPIITEDEFLTMLEE
jgi:DNA ligase (NAD+)